MQITSTPAATQPTRILRPGPDFRWPGGARIAIVFNIAAQPPGDPHKPGMAPDGIVRRTDLAREVNDNVAALVRAHPSKLIGFMSVHPRDPHVVQLPAEYDRLIILRDLIPLWQVWVEVVLTREH